MMKYTLVGLMVIAMFVMAGCSRDRYRTRADWDAYGAIYQKSACTPWESPESYSVYPEPGSRLYDDGCPDDPSLPIPAPQLYAYQIPEFQNLEVDGSDKKSSTAGPITDEGAPEISPIPPEAWKNIPIACRRRMFDFQSLQNEADRTDKRFKSSVSSLDPTDAPLLTLPEIVEVALLNSREYQTQKETLYQVALALSFERFAYQLKPTARGNGANLNYRYFEVDGVAESSLGIPSGIGFDQLLITGGDFLARFANDVLLTFNGPDGFAANVGTDLILELSQPLLQRDIVFEGLTQAERNVVYAARDFARFRKQFFVDFAARYYARLRDFRQIEIESQNYFSLVRAFNQSEAEYRAGLVPRVQVDQVEQDLLSGRRNLISVCNNLEQQLDSLKIEMGLPTETPINIDLTELNQLTQSDQLSVNGDLIQRAEKRLSSALVEPDELELLNAGVVLVDRILAANQLQDELGLDARDTSNVRRLRAILLIDASRLTAREISQGLDAEINSGSPSLAVIFQRLLALVNNLIELSDRQFKYSELSDISPGQLKSLQERQQSAVTASAELQAQLQQMIRDEQLQDLPEIVRLASELRTEVERLVGELDTLNGISQNDLAPGESLQQTEVLVRRLLEEAQEVSGNLGGGLEPIDIDVDPAMLTALVLRFELMNQRGQLADVWRDIKLRGCSSVDTRHQCESATQYSFRGQHSV